MLFNRIAIVGLGLLGGSVAKVCRQQHIANEIIAVDRNSQHLRTALLENSIDYGYKSLLENKQEFDLLIICSPLDSYTEVATALSHIQSDNFLITDVGSTKRHPISTLSHILGPEIMERYIPAHPIAGSEKDGYQASSGKLFNGRKVILTPAMRTPQRAVKIVNEFWQYCGCKVMQLTSEQHDRIYACVSHIPQLLAFCYADFLLSKRFTPHKNILSFNKFRRLAFSNRKLWHSIFNSNQDLLTFYKESFLNSINDHNSLLNNNKLLKDKASSLRQQPNFLEHANSRSDKESCYMLSLPYLISAALIDIIERKHFAYAGTGLSDFLSPVLCNNRCTVDARTKRELKEFIEYCQIYRFSSA